MRLRNFKWRRLRITWKNKKVNESYKQKKQLHTPEQYVPTPYPGGFYPDIICAKLEKTLYFVPLL